jgi:hypothetical protein
MVKATCSKGMSKSLWPEWFKFSLIPEKAIRFAIQDQEDVSLKFRPLYEESPVFFIYPGLRVV